MNGFAIKWTILFFPTFLFVFLLRKFNRKSNWLQPDTLFFYKHNVLLD